MKHSLTRLSSKFSWFFFVSSGSTLYFPLVSLLTLGCFWIISRESISADEFCGNSEPPTVEKLDWSACVVMVNKRNYFNDSISGFLLIICSAYYAIWRGDTSSSWLIIDPVICIGVRVLRLVLLISTISRWISKLRWGNLLGLEFFFFLGFNSIKVYAITYNFESVILLGGNKRSTEDWMLSSGMTQTIHLAHLLGIRHLQSGHILPPSLNVIWVELLLFIF